jgi:hypothetical protein
MEPALRILDEDLVRRRHRAEILRRARLSISRPAVEAMIARLLSEPGPGAAIPPDVLKPLAGATLGSYELEGTLHRISAQDFAEDLNHRIVRHVPRTVADFLGALQDMVIEEYDVRTARQLQLDRAPKFVEDRHNFALNQALAAYEQEVLLRRLHPTHNQLRDYAAARPDAYLASIESSGTLYVFADQAQAERAAARLQHADRISNAVGAMQRIETFIVRVDSPQLLPQLPNGAVIAAANGALFGPFSYAGKPAVFQKRATGNRVAQPFAKIEPQVRRDFLRAKLDEAELALFYGSTTAASLLIHLDPAKYGLPPSFVFGAVPDFRFDQASARPGVRPTGLDETTKKPKNK